MSELARILAIPKRAVDEVWLKELTEHLTKELRTFNGKQTLRPVQALALFDIHNHRGMFGAIVVGGGKSLLSMLAPKVLETKRSVLLLPASLIAKTERERNIYAQDWQVSRSQRIISYEALGRVNNSETLENWKPNLIVADEQHRIKNLRAACTRRVSRYMQAHPETAFVGMSGTIVKHSIRDYAHLLAWALKEGSPAPIIKEEIEAWAQILDEKKDFMGQATGAKKSTELDRLGGATPREGFRNRLVSCPGVIVSQGKSGCDASLLLRGIEYDVSPATEKCFEILRSTWCLPTGYAISDAVEVWRHAREFALGCNYEWRIPGPEDWLEARSNWAKFVRGVLQRSHTYDSEFQVALAVTQGAVDDGGLYAAWKEVKDSFTPDTVCVWHDTSALEACEVWAKKNGPGIIWTSHSFFGTELSKRTGFPYYGAGGLTPDGKDIQDETGKGTIIASLQANGTGRNLQRFSRNLVTSAPSGADQWEQLLGRCHREGQTADEVSYDVLLGCSESLKSMSDARAGAGMIEETTSLTQKLLYCDYDILDKAPGRSWRWQKNEKQETDE